MTAYGMPTRSCIKRVAQSTTVTDLIFYPDRTLLIFEDGHEEVIEIAGIEYEQEEKN